VLVEAVESGDLEVFYHIKKVKVLSQRRLADTASNLSVFNVYLLAYQYISGILMLPEASVVALILNTPYQMP
jgi:hypothetical protein